MTATLRVGQMPCASPIANSRRALTIASALPRRSAQRSKQPRPFEQMAGLDDTALVARERRPVVVEELPQRAGIAIDEIIHRQMRDLIGKVEPGDAIKADDLLARQARFEQMHVRIGARAAAATDRPPRSR